MDKLTEAHFRQRARSTVLSQPLDAFQQLFETVMTARHGSDFVPVKPSGTHGDKKNDGYLLSERCVYAVYAPHYEGSAKTVAKLRSDFEGARKNWPKMRAWSFVHNDRGFPPAALEAFEQLVDENPEISFSHHGPEWLLDSLIELPRQKLEELLGPAPSMEDLLDLGIDDLAAILDHLEAIGDYDPSLVEPVNSGKIEHNGLSPDARSLLAAGMGKRPLVSKYYAQSSDPTLHDRHAAAFRSQYQMLRSQNLSSDQIFGELFVAVGAQLSGSHRSVVGKYAVLAHFFEECEIFENPPAVVGK